MVKTYCVRQRKLTESLPNSQRYVQTKNNRLIEKSICSECNNVKSRFVSNKQGKGIGEIANEQISKRLPGFGPAQKIASTIMGVTGGDKHLFDKYWSGEIAKGAFNKDTGLLSKKFWTHPDKKCRMKLKKIKGKWTNVYDC